MQIQCIKPKIGVVGKSNFIENPVFDSNNFYVCQIGKVSKKKIVEFSTKRVGGFGSADFPLRKT